jgi:predicted glycoside hydrolase/deacetylase ChbG (UPF0249 family)
MTALCAGQPGARPDDAKVPRNRVVVLHADDFGMSEAVNRGVLRGFEQGLLTSTSILANAPGAASALASWPRLERRRAGRVLPSTARRQELRDPPLPFDLGVHLNLTQGRPLTAGKYPELLLDAAGRFPGAWGLFWRLWQHGRHCRQAIQAELSAQIALVIEHGIRPTHLNGHQYLELFPTMGGHFTALMERFNIGLMRIPWETGLTRTALWHQRSPGAWLVAQIKRLFAARLRVALIRQGNPCPGAFRGTATAGRVNLGVLREFLEAHRTGMIEVGLHPGELAPEPVSAVTADGWFDALRPFRPRELEMCTSVRAAEYLAAEKYRLGRLAELRPGGRARSAA